MSNSTKMMVSEIGRSAMSQIPEIQSRPSMTALKIWQNCCFDKFY